MAINMKKLFALAEEGELDAVAKEAQKQTKDYGLQLFLQYMALLRAQDLGNKGAAELLKKTAINEAERPSAHWNMVENYLGSENGLKPDLVIVEEHMKTAKKLWEKGDLSSAKVMVKNLAKKQKGEAQELFAKVFTGAKWK